MRKLLFILSIILLYINSFGQTTRAVTSGFSPRANQFFVVEDGNISARNSLLTPRYTDTTQANIYATWKDTIGNVIFTYDSMALWVRKVVLGSKRWEIVGSGSGGGGSSTWGSITGTLSNQTDLQTALNLKANLASPTFTGTVVFPSPFTLGATSVLTSGAELNFVDGVTSAIQTQLDGKQATITFGTGVLTALGVNIGSAGAVVLFNGAGGTPTSLVGTNISGTASALSIGGNAATATILQTARNIQGVSFNGSAAIDIINGTGFVKASGTTLSYDNSTYLTSVFLPVTGTGTATGAVIGALAGNTLSINQGAVPMLTLDPVQFLSSLFSSDGTAESEYKIYSDLVGNNVKFDISTSDGTNFFQIIAEPISKTLNIKYNAINALQIGEFASALRASDGTYVTELVQSAQTAGDVYFRLRAFNGTTEVVISGDANGDSTYYDAAIHSFDGEVIPEINNGSDLGLITRQWDSLYVSNVSSSIAVNIGTAGSSTGIFTQSGVTSGTITFQPAAAAGTYTLTWPTTDGGVGEFLQTNGSGVLTWAAGGGGLTIGTTTITSGTTTRVLFDNAGVLGEYTISGTGSVAMTASPTFTTSILLAGPTSGTVTLAADALSNAFNGTTLSGTGYVPATMFSRLTSAFTMSDVNTVQPVFSTGQDVWTLQASTTYYFEGFYYLTHGATSHSVGMSFELGGGASVTSIHYQTLTWVTAVNGNTATQLTAYINQTANTTINTAGANAQEVIKFSGWISMNAGGTVQPSITFSAAPGGAPAAGIGTYIKFTPIGTNTVAQLGNVN